MGGSSSQPQTTVQKNEPPAYLQPYYTDVAQQAQNLFQQGAPDYYPGQTVAQPGDATNAALDAITARATGAQPLQTGAEDVYKNVLSPDYLDVNNNPNLQGALDAGNAATIRQFNGQILPGIASTFNLGGRLNSGDGGSAGAVGNATASLADALANNNNSITYDAYNKAKTDQLTTAAGAPALAAAGYNPAQMLAAAGATEDTNTQNNINADIQKYNYQANAPKLNLQDYINLLQGTTGNQGVSTSTATPAGSNGLLSGLSGAASAATLAASLAALSDRRLKVNISKVGKLANGLNWYKFAYAWAPQQMFGGVMADEVMQINPAAVLRGPGGFMMVDYGAL